MEKEKMSSQNFETKWKTTLTSILEELSPPQFRKLIINLDKIPQGRKTETHREEFPDIIIQFYGTEGSISVIDKEMKVLPRKDAKVQEPLQRFVEELKKRRKKIKAGGNTAAPSTSAAAPPAAPASMMAQQGSNIIAPNIAGSSIGTLNINIPN